MKFLGVYDYTVVLTYLSLISSVFGMTRAIHGDYKLAIFCLAFSGICDAFDGRIARMKKDRTADEKNFGIQLDALCDVICFGAFPALICYLLGVRGALGVALVIFYVVGSVAKNKHHKVEEEGTLSWERAAAVAKIMIEHCGVPARNIRLIGAGFTTFTWRNAIEFPDGVNPSESNMKLNRVVAVVPSYSEQYTKELQSKNGSNKDLTAIACLYGDHPRSN